MSMEKVDSHARGSLWVGVGALLALAGVLLGAFGAHALAERLAETGRDAVWQTGVQYLQIHALGIILAGLWMGVGGEVALRHGPWIALLWLAGILLFSGSLFGLALGGPGWLGPVTPLGGISFAVGWLWLSVAALGGRKKS